MDWIIKLAIMLAAGLLAKHVSTHLLSGMTLRRAPRIPRLCCYAAAGITAALFRAALQTWASPNPVLLWIAFGTVWGVVAGVTLSLFSRRKAEV